MSKQAFSIKYILAAFVAVLVLGWWLQPTQPVELIDKSYSCSKTQCKIKAQVINLTEDSVKAILQVKAIEVVTHSPGAQTNKVMTSKVVRYSLAPNQSRTIEAEFKVYDRPNRLIWFVGEDKENQ